MLYCREKEIKPNLSMKNTYPKKFALIGLPGSGKSTFASKLGKILDIPVHHLDRHMFEPGGKKRDKQEFIETQKAMLEEKAWIVEGCSFSTFEMRFAKADVLIYFGHTDPQIIIPNGGHVKINCACKDNRISLSYTCYARGANAARAGSYRLQPLSST